MRGRTSWSPNGRKLATADYTAISIWTTRGVLEGEVTARADYLLFSPDGSLIATMATTFDSHQVQLWRVADGTLLTTLEAASSTSI